MPSVLCKIVEICVFRFKGNRPEYLLLKRSPDERIYPDLWQMVSGTISDGESGVDAARRELTEETGLAPKRFWVVPHVNAFFDPGYDAVNVSPLFAAQVSQGDEPSLSDEHCVFQWLPYEEARRRLVWPGQRRGLDVVHEFILGGEEAASRTTIEP
jgi:8-oxo-dGTP pyrophosphatase MutT (NUDIX family)